MTDDVDAAQYIAIEMPEVERLALISVRDGGPISDALTSKLFARLLIKSVRVGTALSPRIEHRLTVLGARVAARINGPKHTQATEANDV